MTHQEIIKKLKILKATKGIDNKFIAQYLELKNARSIANYLHNDYLLSDPKKQKAIELINTLWEDI